MPTLIIDADACPVTREALACARSARIPVLIAGNSTQNLARRIRRDDPRDAEHARGRDATHPGFWAETLDVSCGADSADFAIIERLQPGDVVVTQDIGLASMVLGRGAAAIGCAGASTTRPLSTCSCSSAMRRKRSAARAGARRGRPPSPMTTARRFQRNLAQLRDALANQPRTPQNRVGAKRHRLDPTQEGLGTTRHRDLPHYKHTGRRPYIPNAANTRPHTHATKNRHATITAFSRGWRLVRNSTR